MHAAAQNRPDVKAAREVWREEHPALPAESLIFIDESGLTTFMARRSGRSPIGERFLAKTPLGHWRTTTFIAALRSDGVTAPITLDGPMDGEHLRAWTEQFLPPVLKSNDIVVTANLPCHKVTGIRKAIEARGAELLYLPPYIPDLNPIEMVFAKFKAALRKATSRTIAKLWDEIAETLSTSPPQECASYIKYCGYAN